METTDPVLTLKKDFELYKKLFPEQPITAEEFSKLNGDTGFVLQGIIESGSPYAIPCAAYALETGNGHKEKIKKMLSDNSNFIEAKTALYITVRNHQRKNGNDKFIYAAADDIRTLKKYGVDTVTMA